MIRATTPTHVFMIPLDPAELKEILITYAQGRHIVLEKRKEQLKLGERIEGDTPLWQVWVTLTQQETAQFRQEAVSIQMRVLTAAGQALASEIRTIAVQDVLDDEVLL